MSSDKIEELPVVSATPSLPIFPPLHNTDKLVTLELKNGISVQGYSFGADKSVAGELVFQTGMVGYPESITDPSYEGQILVITFPLVGNYGVPSRDEMDELVPQLPRYFESNRIHVAGLVVASYTEEYSHFLAKSSLGTWLKEEGIPAIYGVDTRGLTKLIRTQGSTLSRIRLQKEKVNPALSWDENFEEVEYDDPNVKNLVARVSIKEPVLYKPASSVTPVVDSTGKTLRILAIDVGMKYNQVRCFVNRGVELKVVPWDYDFVGAGEQYDGLFVSNGPGDPATLTSVVKRLETVVEQAKTPIFGICLGHQLLASASGASTLKLKFGNRGHNIPATNLISGRCYITSQNHGYAVDVNTLKEGWKELFVNANDGSNEGIYHTSKPIFSVQFHPESTPGPRDTEFLFDVFINTVLKHKNAGGKPIGPVEFPGGTIEENRAKHPRVHAKKVLVLGSGGLSIGQAGEFDYSGSQAIKALKQEGIYTILINPNIATIQTSKGLADKVYFLPVNADFVRKVIKYENPDAIYVTFGGQTALNVGIQLKDEFESLGVKVLGTPIDTIITTEDRELFARSMEEIGEKCAKSATASTTAEALEVVKEIKFPVIVRAAYALGGLGSGFAENEEQLVALCQKAFAASPQILIERSMKGWKEIEYEVVRDAFDNCITVCNMENFDPLGIHTGDSIVVAPSQTLSDEDYNMLRTTAVNVIRHLGVVGECNIQYALNPFSKEYCIIEVNARLSRSSALASKATGYPLAFIAAKLGLNIPLNEIKNSVTKVTCACFEPSLDYVVVKIPRWDLKKFTRVSKELSSSMKSVGEVMSIGRTFEEAIQKAIRSTDYQNLGFNATEALMSIDIDDELQTPSDQRLFAIANAFDSGYTVDKVWSLTKIDKWFLHKLENLIKFAKMMEQFQSKTIPSTTMRQAKQLGFEDRQIAKFVSSNELSIRRLRVEAGITPFVKQIDTVAAEFPAFTNYLYLTYNADSHDIDFNDNGVMVLGSGVYRIGSSVEFDWCAVRAVRTLREQGTKTIMVNYNPETVSTDYDEADRLYFEVINLERVLDIYQLEQSAGVVISMGGQTSNNIALTLHRENVKILGTSPDMIDSAENRYKFSRMLDKIGVDQPAWKELTSIEEAEAFADKVSYPVLVRPSYVLSGAAMNTVYSRDDLESYLKQAVEVSRDYPVVITKYIENAKEIEMDAVAKDGKLVMHVVSEHVENAGVHSGDATLIVPPQDLSAETVKRIVEATAKIGQALNVSGPYNIQFIAKDNEIKVIECNVRASRSFPFVSKVLGVDLIEMATKVIAGVPIQPYPLQQLPEDYVAIKVPQFSFSRLSGADPVLGVEMASTGEVACFGRNKYEAYLKSLIATGIKPPKKNILLSIGSFKEKTELLPSVKKLHELGYKLFATAGTADFIQEHGIPVQYLEVLNEGEDEKSEFSLTQHLANNLIDMYINLPSSNRFRRPASYMSKGYRTRRMAVDYAIPLVTNVKCAKLLVEALALNIPLEVSSIDSQSSHRLLSLPGLINIATFVPSLLSAGGSPDFEKVSEASLKAGFTITRILPTGVDGSITDALSLLTAQENTRGKSAVDFNLSIAATGDNASQLVKASPNVGSLVIPFNYFNNNLDKVATVSEHFNVWPTSKPIVTDASSTDLASILLLASLHNRPVHVTNVLKKADLALISMAKEKGLKVTCDVSIHALFLSQVEFPGCSHLPTKEDQEGLWEGLESIDIFAVGVLPSQLAKSLGLTVEAGVGIADALPLLLTAVRENKLTVEDIVLRLSTNPKKIFDLHDQSGTTVEVDLDRQTTVSSFYSKPLYGTVERVTYNDKTVVLEGKIVVSDFHLGKDVSGHSNAAQVVPASPLVKGGAVFASPRPASPTGVSGFNAQARKMSFNAVSVVAPGGRADLDSALVLEDDDKSKGPTLKLVTEPQLPSALRNVIRKNNPFLRRHVTSVLDFSRSDLHSLFSLAQELRLAVERVGAVDLLRGRVLATLFYEPSTRTSTSFDAAMQRLGGKVISITTSTSSVQKGETLQDTVRTLASYTDAIVLRHPSEESVAIASKYSPVPIINGGNGSKEHPTQAFLDLFTIREELGTVNGLTVTFMGDLKYGRTVHSLCSLLKHYQVRVQIVCPKDLALPAHVYDELAKAGKITVVSENLTDEILENTDVLYCTRVQKERFPSLDEYEKFKNLYVVDNKVLRKAKKHMCVMHPLPRVNEISEEVDFDHRAAYFRQMRHGLFVRMALLAMVIGVDF
ncbi:bifunctional carbamoylphosphate synthetase/aspartate transcarbamylase [Sugiyamaella lignohabitans]|uniref:Pyrimidine-specific carbamoyl phosphate synthase-aspartate carbamoyl transferase n=1 Tax=Sugiyamaella lignohabitans TaxID=796027 RepID=A0A167ETX0_9ASCO|nr:bifunctional carbamoylphosphate synthetase/aspartate transcarbamylase [Sugiyamaella lignohabitans]ANB14448.1 bifunctional carbamoylphosphate synthetase/aspartate transcarbamylase [Sugiyamaella lignohabitans]